MKEASVGCWLRSLAFAIFDPGPSWIFEREAVLESQDNKRHIVLEISFGGEMTEDGRGGS